MDEPALCACGNLAWVKGKCKTCYHRDYYREQRRPKLLAYLGDSCAWCGSTEDLQFDHVHPEDKAFEIKDNMTLNASVRAELDKCQLLCATCHRTKTSRENTKDNHGSMRMWMKRKCHCDVCNDARQEWNEARNERRRAENAALGRGRGPYRSGHKQDS